jgi:hypothetical protein
MSKFLIDDGSWKLEVGSWKNLFYFILERLILKSIKFSFS